MILGQQETKIPCGVQHGKKKKRERERKKQRNEKKKKTTGKGGIIGGRPLIIWERTRLKTVINSW